MKRTRLNGVPQTHQCVFFYVKAWVYCRIDYHLATPAVAALAKTEHIYKEQRFSDHAPMTVDYELAL